MRVRMLLRISWGLISRGKGREIGIHQFYQGIALKDPSAKVFDAIDLSSQQMASAMLIEYVFRMGVDPRFVSIASNVLPTNVKWLTLEELKEFKVAYDPDDFDPWQIEAYGAGLFAFSRTQDRTKAATLFCGKDRSPKILPDWPADTSNSEFNSTLDKVGDIDLVGIKIPRSQVKGSVENGRSKLTIDAQSATPTLLSANTKAFYVGFGEQAGRHLLNYIPFHIESAGLQKAARLAFRNCI